MERECSENRKALLKIMWEKWRSSKSEREEAINKENREKTERPRKINKNVTIEEL